MVKQEFDEGIAHLILIAVVAILLIGGAAVFIITGSNRSPKFSNNTVANSLSPTPATTTSNESTNPFEKTSQYTNPFEDNKNPFDYLNE